MSKKIEAKILCVDDEMGVLDSLERLLQKDFTVLRASNAEEALKILDQHSDIAIVLSDYRMPGMSGIELLQQVRRQSPHTLRAILSGQIDVQNLINAINTAEIHRFILKPWENNYLKLQMYEALQTHIHLAEKDHLKHLSITDPVTGLTNHRFFQDRLRQELTEAQSHEYPLSIIMLDVDHFKAFNDEHGHPAGDRLLAQIADLMGNFVERNGFFVSRYGGEEFVMILPKVGSLEALDIAEKLRKKVENFSFLDPSGQKTHITVSSGVATAATAAPNSTQTAEQLINAADRALYQSKRQGRNKSSLASF